jgi:hypothetical protein
MKRLLLFMLTVTFLSGCDRSTNRNDNERGLTDESEDMSLTVILLSKGIITTHLAAPLRNVNLPFKCCITT